MWWLLACSPPVVEQASSRAAFLGDTAVTDTGDTACIDHDGDGYARAEGDCDDRNASVHPGATEVCNDLDDDCDGQVDYGRRVPANHLTLQNAIYEASDGDTICVSPGTHAGPIDLLGRSVTIVGHGPELTILEGGPQWPVVQIQYGEMVELHGLTVTGGTHGVEVDAASLSLVDVVVRDNLCEDIYGCSGAGLLLDEATVAMERVTLSNNHAQPYYYGTARGGGLAAFDSEITAQDVQVLQNSAAGNSDASSLGAGIYLEDSSLVASRLAVLGNELGDWSHAAGAGLHLSDSAVELVNATVAGNTGGEGAGFAVSGGELSLVQVTAAGNTATDDGAEGGGLRLVSDASVVLDGVVLTDNAITGAGGAGSALFVDASCQVDIAYSDIWGNTGAAAFDGLSDPSGSNGNVSVDPLYVDATSGDASLWDLHLEPGSPVIDAGDPARTDPDGTAADMGAYGGPDGDW